MSRSFFVKVNATEFRGAAHGVVMSRIIFSNLPKFSKICNPVAGSAIIFHNYRQTRKNLLTPVAIRAILPGWARGPAETRII